MVEVFELERGELSDEAREIAKNELRESEVNVKNGIKELRILLKEDTDLNFSDDNETLTVFLRTCKWYPSSAYELMKRIAAFKKSNKQYVLGLLPGEIKESFTNYSVVNILKDRDGKGRRVLVLNCGGIWDPSKVTGEQLFKIFYVAHEVALLEPETQIRGVVVIMDFRNMGLKQVAAFRPSYCKILFDFIQDALPLRLKEVHIINQPMIFNIVWTMLKSFLREKLKSRIFFHGANMKSLHKYLEPGHLPSNYGGELHGIDYNGANWYPAIENHMDYMRKWSSFGYKDFVVIKK